MAEEFHDRLRKAREARFSTGTEAAKAMGMTPATYLGHENGSRGGASKKNGEKYARFFGVSYTWLMTGRGPMKGAGAPDPFEGLADDDRRTVESLIQSLKRKRPA